MPLTRLENWPRLLADYIEARKTEKFEWGKNDCVLFALGSVEAITGLDAAADIRGTYATPIGAARRMKSLYGSPALDKAASAFAARWGGVEIAPAMCGRGDLVLHNSPAGPALGVCMGLQFAAAGVDGVAWHSMKTALRGWKV